MTDSVAGDYLRVVLAIEHGKLRHSMILAEALRGAFLIDFARIGKLEERASGSQLDTSPTGSDSADDLLREVDEHPQRTMQRWLQRGVPHVHEVIAELIADRVWTAERHGFADLHVHYVDVDAARYDELAKVLESVVHGRVAAVDARQAALAALASVTGLTTVEPLTQVPEHLLQACRTLEPVVRDVIEFLQAADTQARAVAYVTESTALGQLGAI
jgi:hypothetical protein